MFASVSRKNAKPTGAECQRVSTGGFYFSVFLCSAFYTYFLTPLLVTLSPSTMFTNNKRKGRALLQASNAVPPLAPLAPCGVRTRITTPRVKFHRTGIAGRTCLVATSAAGVASLEPRERKGASCSTGKSSRTRFSEQEHEYLSHMHAAALFSIRELTPAGTSTTRSQERTRRVRRRIATHDHERTNYKECAAAVGYIHTYIHT